MVKLANPTRSIEDKRALSLMERTTVKIDGEDAYVSGLLWREEDPHLPNNFNMAKQRLKSLEKKFENNPEIRERYAQSIQDDVQKGYVKKLSEAELQSESKITWYLLHRFVINPKKPDRLRRVYDASAKFMGQSLNDKIFTGRNLLSSLCGVLLRFCEGRIAMAADVKEMYHMLRLPERDKPSMRFLWRESPEEEPSVYQFERTVFGEVSAPSRANYAMRRYADENRDLPLGVKAVYKHFYMDDGLPSTNSREEAIEMRKQLTELLRRGGFRLHKWLTNDPEVLATIPEQDRSPQFLELSENKLPTDRAFGVVWDAEEDVLKFTGLQGDAGTTKRKILSQVFSVWDPRGLLLPFSIRSKIVLQNLNRMKYGWDDELMEDDLRVWREWRREAAELDVVKIPRALLSPDKPVREASLQVFSDASQDAYGACAYFRRKFKDNAVECRLVAGKGRVAPLKAQSICRLELTGALLAARLAETLTAELMMKIEKTAFWSDSTTVLHWIDQTSSNYKEFVGNRVSEIHTIMSDLDSTLGAGKVCSICHYGGRPRFLAAPPLTLNLPLMASKETLEQVKNLLKQELSPINAKLDGFTTKLSDIDTAVNFLSGKYDALLNQLKDTNRKVNSHASDVAKVKENLKEIEKLAYSASSEVEQIAQYLRRDCLEITGIATNEECSAEAIIKSIGDVIGVPLQDNDISIAHPIPAYKVGAPPKLIVKFTRRSVRDKFYLNRRKLARKKAKDLPNLNLSSEADVFVSESLTSFKKKLFGDVNKVKKHLKWNESNV